MARDKAGKGPTYPGDYIFFGVIIQAVGGAVLAFGLAADILAPIIIGAMIGFVGTIVTMVGVVGQGVLIGMRAVRSET